MILSEKGRTSQMKLGDLEQREVIGPNSNFYEGFLIGKRGQKAVNSMQTVAVNSASSCSPFLMLCFNQ